MPIVNLFLAVSSIVKTKLKIKFMITIQKY
jgi:hypothetical protein